MNALPILLLGGAALMMMGGGGKKKNVVESGLLESGEKWRIKHVGQWSDGAGVFGTDAQGMAASAVEAAHAFAEAHTVIVGDKKVKISSPPCGQK